MTRAGRVGSDIDVGAFGDASLWGQVTCRAKGSRALTVQSLDSKILKWMLCCLGFLSSTCCHLLREYCYLPQKKGAETQSRLDSFWWPLEGPVFVRPGHGTPRAMETLWGLDMWQDGVDTGFDYHELQVTRERFVSLGIRLSSKRLQEVWKFREKKYWLRFA